MRLSWVSPPGPAASVPAAVRIRELESADEAAVGRLMWTAFRGTVDDPYAAPSDARQDAADAIAGKWGPVVWRASLAAELHSVLVAAVIVVRDNAHEDVPLLAFAMTDPGHQRRGLGQRLIEESILRLGATGLTELHLAVTRGNPAIALYQRLGFQIVGG
jgi:ribosomal protein S18 acetylase RimI-like enzyme